MDRIREYYEILGLPAGASQAAIKQAYRTLAKRWHPDRVANDPQRRQAAEERLKQINEAYEQLQAQWVFLSTPLVSNEDAWLSQFERASFHYQRGVTSTRHGNLQEAIAYFTEAIRLDPSYMDAYKERWMVYEKLGQNYLANADFQRFLALERQKTAPVDAPAEDESEDVPNAVPNAKDTAKDSKGWHCQHVLRSHADIISALVTAPNGRVFASSSHDGTVRLWRLGKGREICILDDGNIPVRCLAASGKLLASAGDDKSIKLWNLETGEHVRTLGGWFGGHSDSILTVALSPKGKRLASGSADRTLKLWHIPTGKAAHSLISGAAVRAIAINPKGKVLVSTSGDRALKVQRLSNGQLLRALETEGKVAAIAIHPEGEWLACAAGDRVECWHLGTGERFDTLAGHRAEVAAIAFSPQGDALVSGDRDGSLRIWDLTSEGGCQVLETHVGSITAVSFGADRHTPIVGGSDNTIQIWQWFA